MSKMNVKKLLLLLLITFGLLGNSDSNSSSADSLLNRCLAVFSSQSREVGQRFREALADLGPSERQAFAQYLEMLMADVGRSTHHISEIQTAQKEEILKTLLNTWNPTDLVDAYV